jgi:hypothetical protein
VVHVFSGAVAGLLTPPSDRVRGLGTCFEAASKNQLFLSQQSRSYLENPSKAGITSTSHTVALRGLSERGGIALIRTHGWTNAFRRTRNPDRRHCEVTTQLRHGWLLPASTVFSKHGYRRSDVKYISYLYFSSVFSRSLYFKSMTTLPFFA